MMARLIGAGLFAVFLGVCGSVWAWPPAPPVLYEGRPLRAWVADLTAPDALVREEAVEILGQAGPAAKEAVPQLEKMLRQGGILATRVRVAVALWHIDGRKKEAALVLAECLRHGKPSISRALTLDYLGQLGADAAPAVDAILDLSDTPDFVLRTQIDRTLRRLGATAAPGIVRALSSSKSGLRRHAVIFLAQRHGPPLPGTLDALTPLLEDREALVQQLAASLLWRHGQQTEAAAAILVQAVDSPSQILRRQVVDLVFLSEKLSKETLPLFKAALASSDLYVRQRAASRLSRLEGKNADLLPLCLKALADEDRIIWQAGAAAIARIGPEAKAAIPALIKRLEARDDPLHGPELAQALAAVGPAVVVPLVEALKTNRLSNAARLQAVGALARIGPRALPVLRSLLTSPDPKLRATVLAVLESLGPQAKDAVPDLIKILENNEAGARPALLRTLGAIGWEAHEALPLLGKLAMAPDEATRIAALAALGRITRDPRELVARALIALDDREPEVRMRGLELLVRADSRHPRVLPAMRTLLDRPSMRLELFTLLPRMGPAGAALVPALVELLDHRDPLVRLRVLAVLGQMGPAARSAVPALVKGLKEDRQMRAHALQALNSLGPTAEAAVPALAELLEDSDHGTRREVLYALGQIGSAACRAAPEVIPFLKDSDPGMRRLAVTTLGQMGPGAHAALPDVLDLLEDRFGAQGAALTTLRIIRTEGDGKRSVEKVVALLRKTRFSDFSAVAELLGDLGHAAAPALPFLRTELHRSNSPHRVAAASALAYIDPELARKEAVPVLEDILHALPASVAAAFVLHGIDPGNREAVAAFRQGLADENAFTRSQAADLLGRCGPEAKWALPALRKALTDEAAQVCIAAAGALWQIDREAKTALPVLIKELRQATPEHLRGVAATKLGAMGAAARPAVPALLEALRDNLLNTRVQAQTSLQRIEDASGAASEQAPKPSKPR